MGGVDDNSLKEELETCERFLVDSEIEKRRQRVYNFAMDSLDPKSLLAKLNVVFGSLKCADNLNVAFGFLVKNVKDGSCRYYDAHENGTVLERSQLVAATEDLTKVKNPLSNTDVIE